MTELLKLPEIFIEDQRTMLLAAYTGLKKRISEIRDSAVRLSGDGEDDPHLDHQPPVDYVANSVNPDVLAAI